MFRKIKYLLSVITLVALTITFAKAKDEPSSSSSATAGNPVSIVKKPKKSADQKAAALTDTLSSIVSLTPGQYSKALASNLKFVIQKEAALKNNNGDFQVVKEQIKVLNKTRKSEMAAFLTPEQIAKWEAWKQARKAQGLSKKEQFIQNHPNATGKLKNQQINQPDNGVTPSIMDDIDGM